MILVGVNSSNYFPLILISASIEISLIWNHFTTSSWVHSDIFLGIYLNNSSLSIILCFIKNNSKLTYNQNNKLINQILFVKLFVKLKPYYITFEKLSK